jgi:hypothetical protein
MHFDRVRGFEVCKITKASPDYLGRSQRSHANMGPHLGGKTTEAKSTDCRSHLINKISPVQVSDALVDGGTQVLNRRDSSYGLVKRNIIFFQCYIQ